ncbi:hypothetical protein LIER_22458 [Lithospermum erythrorhizon]|uniref:Uncharacterized protein n=1 Tax=Lithospermum erythrorhizon TaxID=34254 RepID=A0AAV3QX80_LITER
MSSAASWLHSFLSSTNNSSIFQRFRRYRFAIKTFLRGTKAGKGGAKDSFQNEKEAWASATKNVAEIEEILGYRFKNIKLLHEAFTHPSYGEHYESYERLEYVGDSVLNLLITKQQFSTYPDLPPGLLSPLRAANVDTEKLGRVAINHNFHKYILHGKPIIEKRIQQFENALPRYPLHSHGMLNAPKVLADVVESTIGAIFIDTNSSIEMTWQVVKPLLKPIITPNMLQTNPVKKLFEMCQKNKLNVRFNDLGLQNGAYMYEVFIDDQLRGKSRCPSKRVALNRAANNAYKEVVEALDMRLH